MPALSLAPALSLFTAFGRLSPTQPIRTLIRGTGFKLRPPRPMPFAPINRKRQEMVLASGLAQPHQAITILSEQRKGSVPTLVLGGFVPDAPEQVYMLRGFLLKSGSVYYLNYSRTGFSVDLFCAQLDDLIDELVERNGTPPVIISVSFGCGLVMEWLKRARRAGRRIDLKGLILVSPVACVEDLLSPGSAKPTTLIGRAIKPYLDPNAVLDANLVERSRAIFSKMFEAGAQNKNSLRVLMTRGELKHLHSAIINTVRSIEPTGACQRVQALRHMEPPCSYFSQTLLPLTEAPTLILYAEKESSVIAEHSPTRFALQSAHRAYFPQSYCKVISNHSGSPVQHASLIFHCFNFLPPISAFYKHIKTARLQRVA